MEYFITVDGIPLHVNDSKKDGTAILFLHGYLETLYIWEEFISFFPDTFRLISIDLPGHGLSGYPSQTPDILFLTGIIRDLLNKLSIDKCHIVTHLCSYYIACKYSSIYPDSVYSIVNIGSGFLLENTEVNFIYSLKSSISDDNFLKFTYSFLPRMYARGNLRSCDEKIEETIEICETHDPEGINFFLDSILSYTFSPISVPVLSIIGDHFLFDSESTDTFTDHFFSEVKTVPGTGVNCFIEHPFESYSLISSFFHI